MVSAETHFDNIAQEYDYWKRHNSYYYRSLIALYRTLIPAGASVVEIGCGTGDIITSLEAGQALGIDISRAMIDIARSKHANKPNVRFEVADILAVEDLFDADFVFLADVMEHVSNPAGFLCGLSRRLRPGTAVIVSVANPMWEPLLLAAERLGMKMPEGPHERLSISETEKLFLSSGLAICDKGYRLLVPKKLPGSDWLNARFHKSRLLDKLGFVVYWVLKK